MLQKSFICAMVDIYEDLENFDFGEEVEKLRDENRVLLDKISELEEENKVLTRKNTVIEKEVKELRTNISSLLKTSTAEIQRKDKTIAELRERENNVPIKLPKPFLKHNPTNNKPAVHQGRQSEKAHFGIFKQAGFPQQKGPTNRTTCQPTNEERKHTSRNLLNSQQESTSISFASELGNALPVKDTQVDLFGIGQRNENSPSFHNFTKTVLFGANETSQNDSLQNSIKAELDQTSSQLFDKVLERRLRQTQMEFEKDYSEVENSLHSKPFENKTSHKSPTRKCASPRNKRDDYKRSISRHRSRSRSNEQIKRNIIIRSRSPLRRPDHKSFHQGRSNSRDRKNNFHDNSSFQGRSGKHDRYNEKGRRETERYFSRNIDRLRLDRKENYNDSSRKLSEERRRESNASGDSNRSSKHGHESGRKPSPARQSKCISKASLNDRLGIRKEKYAKNEQNTHFIDETHIPRKNIKLGNNSPHHKVHKTSDLNATDKQEYLLLSTDYDIEEGEIQEPQTINDAKKTACVPVHNTAKNDIPNTKLRLREAKEMLDRTHSVKLVDSPIIHHGLKQTKPDGEPNTHFNDETHIPRKKIKLGNNSPHHKVHKTSDLNATDKQENLSQSTDYNIGEGRIQEPQTINDDKKTACVPVYNTAKNDIPNTKVCLMEAKEIPDRTHSVKLVDSSIIHHGFKQNKPDEEPNTHFNDETNIPRKKIILRNNSPHHKAHKTSDLSATDKQENLSQSADYNIEEGRIQEPQTINDDKKTACVPVHNTAKNDIPNTKVCLTEAKEIPDRTHSVKLVDSSIIHHGLKQNKPDEEPNTHFNDETHISRKKIKLGNNSPHHKAHKTSDLSATDKQENLSQSADYNIEEGRIQEPQTINDDKKTACVPVHNTAKNDIPNTKVCLTEAKEIPDRTHSVKLVDSSIIHHGLKQNKPDEEPNTHFNDETHISRKKIKLGNNSPHHKAHKTSDLSATDKQENLSQSADYNIEEGRIQEPQTINDDKKTACVPVHNTAKNDIPNTKVCLTEAKEIPDRTHSVKLVDSSIIHHGLKQNKPDEEPNTHFNDETHIPRKKIKLGNNSPHHKAHKTSDLSATDKQENLSQSADYNIEEGVIQEQQTINDAKKTACVPIHNTAENDNLSFKGCLREAKEMQDRIHSVKVESPIMHHGLKPTETDGDSNTYFNNEMHIPRNKIKLGNNSPHHEVHKSSEFSSTDKEGNFSQPTNYNIEEGEIQGQQTVKDANKTACVSVHNTAKNENPNIKLYSREAKEMSDITHSEKVVDSSIIHQGVKPTEPDGDSKTPSMTLTVDSTDSNSYSVKITKRPRRNIKYYFTDDGDSKETAKITPEVKAPVLITKENSENIHAINKPSVSSRHDTKDVKKHLVQSEMKGDTSIPKKHLEQDENKSESSVSKLNHEKSDSISEAVPQINLEKSATKSEASSKNSPEKSVLKCHTSVPKYYSEKHSANPEKSELKCNSLITKNKLGRYDLFGDCGESDLKCNLSENSPEKMEVVDTCVAKSNSPKLDSTYFNHTSNQLRKSDLKCYTRKSKISLENSFTSKHTHADNLESKCDTAKHHHEKSGTNESKSQIDNLDTKNDTSKHKHHEKSDTNESKSHMENLDTKYDTSKHKHHEKSDATKPKTHVEISDSKCDTNKSIHHVEKSDSNEENLDLNYETSKNKSHIDKSDSSKSKTHVNNSKSDSSKTKIQLEKCDIGETDNEKSDNDKPKIHLQKAESKSEASKPKIHLENSNSKSDFSKPKTLVDKCETSKHKSHLEKFDSSKKKPHLDSSESKSDSSKTKIHTHSSESNSDSSKTKTHLDNLDSKHDSIKTKTYLEKYDTGKATNNIDKSDTNKPKTHLEKSDSKCDNSKTKIILEKSDSWKPKIHLENSKTESDSSKSKTHMENSESKSETSKHKNHLEKSNTSKPKTHQDNSEAKCDSIKPKKQLEKTNSKCKSKKHIEKYDLFGETSEYDIHSRKTDLFGEISNPKSKNDLKSVTSVSKNSKGKSDSKCEFSKVKNNTDKSDTALPKSVFKSDTCKTTIDLDKPGTTVSKSFSKSETSNTVIDLHKSDTTEPKSVLKRDTSNTTIDLDKSDPTMPKLVPKGDTSNATADLDTTLPKLVPKGDIGNTTIILDKSDTTMPKLVSKSDTKKITNDLEKSNEKHILAEFKQIEEKPVVKCESNSPASIRKTCVTPISENTLHVKIFRRNTIIKKLSN